jgi:hypothetical protein
MGGWQIKVLSRSRSSFLRKINSMTTSARRRALEHCAQRRLGSNLHETGFDGLHARRSRVFRVSQPGQHFVGRHDITELLDDVFQSAPMLVVR